MGSTRIIEKLLEKDYAAIESEAIKVLELIQN
jgi:hypothetical protein